MKKLVTFVLVMLVVATISANFSFAQRSRAYNGDKASREITKSQKTFKALIVDLKEQKSELEKSKAKMLKQPALYEVAIVKTDSLINLYQQKIMMLEDQMITFAVTAAGKDEQNRVELKSRDVTALADAYMTIKYADNMSANNVNANASAGTNGKQLIGMVENAGYMNPVVVKITGPGMFSVEYTLGSKEKSPEFFLPCPGNYTATFVSRYGTRCITKKVWPNTVYHDGEKPLDFKATLLP